MIRIGIAGKTIPEFIIYVQSIIDGITGNADFPGPVPLPADLQTELNLLMDYQEATLNGGLAETLIRDQQYEKVKTMLTKLGAFVEWKADNDPVKIASTGFGTRSNATPGGDLPAPTGLIAKSNVSTKVDLRFNRVLGRRIYVIQITQNVAGAWTEAGKTGKTKFTVENLISGRQYWFRVIASGINGDSPASDPASTFVL